MTTGTATPLLDGLATFLREDGWPVALAPAPDRAVSTRCAGTTAEWVATGRTFEQQRQVVFDSAVPVTVPEELRPGFALLLAKANWNLHTGAFALDPSTGAVRLRTSLVAPGPELPPEAAKALVYPNVLIVDRCLPTLVAAADGSLTVPEALAQLAI